MRRQLELPLPPRRPGHALRRYPASRVEVPKDALAPPPQSGRARNHLRGLVSGSSRAACFRVSGKSFGEGRSSAARHLLGHAASLRNRSVRRRGLEPDQERTDPSLSRTIRHDRLTPIPTDSDAKCLIARPPVTIGDDSFSAPSARPEWDAALHHALVARATELAATLPADAVERALQDALTTATAEGRWADVAALAHDLEARRRARAETVDLGVARSRSSASSRVWHRRSGTRTGSSSHGWTNRPRRPGTATSGRRTAT